jgi:DNA-binding CsgD family transcriptional regulator
LDGPSHTDYRRAIELVAELYSAPNAGECRARFARGIVHFVGCDVAVDLVTPHLARALQIVAVREARGAAIASSPLTAREAEVLEHVAAGATNGEIASTLGISPRTVQAHLANVFEKLRTRSRAGAVARVLREEFESAATSSSAAPVSG